MTQLQSILNAPSLQQPRLDIFSTKCPLEPSPNLQCLIFSGHFVMLVKFYKNWILESGLKNL